MDKVLIYRLGSIGDTVLALPAFKLVRREFPNAKITLLTNLPVSEKAAPLTSVLGETGLFDDVMRYPIGLRSFEGMTELWRQLRKHRFDLMVYLTAPRGVGKVLRDTLFFRSCGISRIVGLKANLKGLRPLALAGSDLYEWEASRIARSVEDIGKIDLQDDSSWDLSLTREEHSRAEEVLRSFGVRRPFVVGSIGTKVNVNDWGDENWSELLRGVERMDPSLGLVMVGSSDETLRTERLLQHWSSSKGNACGMVTPRVAAAIISRANLFLGHDSGPMHLAGAVGTPCVAVFAARNVPGQWYPRGRNNVVLYKRAFCYGCQLDVCPIYQKSCIKMVDVPEVLNAVRMILDSGHSSERTR